MSGPDHYVEAEKHIHWACESAADNNPRIEEMHLRYAQVHATLALAAGSALVGDVEDIEPLLATWRAVAS